MAGKNVKAAKKGGGKQLKLTKKTSFNIKKNFFSLPK